MLTSAAGDPQSCRKDRGIMYKLIGLILAAIPVVLLLRSVFTARPKGRSQAMSNFRRQVDYLVWAILFLIGCEVVYLIVTLVLS
jgi:hypothetical protein